jgi:glucosylceramidase
MKVGLNGFNRRRGLGGPGRPLGVLLAVSCACALFAALATAGVTGLKRSHGVSAPVANGTEVGALTIASLSAAADPSVGLIVTATFNGDIERYLGRGQLANGVLALVLTPKAGGQPPTGVLDAGGGVSALGVPILQRSGGRVSDGSRRIEVFGPERVQLMTVARPIAVIRDHNRVMLYIGGAGVSRLARLELKLFDRAPRPAAGASYDGLGSAWRAVVRARPRDRGSLNVDASKLTCAQLESSRAQQAGVLSSGIVPELRGQQQAQQLLKAALGRSRKAAAVPTVRRDWLSALRLTARKVRQLQSQIAVLRRLVTQIDGVHKVCVLPPPPRTSTPTTAPSPPATAPSPPATTASPPPTTPSQPATTTTTSTSATLPPPSVSAVSPSSGPTAGGTSVRITGSGLTGTSAVRFGAQTAGSFTVDGDGQITASSPGAAAGTVDVTVTTPAGTSATSAADRYTYQAPPPPPVQVVQTDSALGQALTPQPGLQMTGSAPQGVPVINVNEQVRYQQFSGLGGAMTDSSAWLLNNKMSPPQRTALMQELFGQPNSGSGLAAPPIHLNFLRIGVAATGAMTVTPAYSYDDNPPGGSDSDLTQFSIGHDTPYIIPTLQQALQVNPGLHVLASPWSSPGWMKSNNALSNQSNGGTLLTADYRPYANYLVKFIQAYARAGIRIQAITPANEPTVATPYPGLNLPESAEANFIADYLQPALSAASLNTKIYGNELSWDQFSRYATPLATDTSARPDLAGTAWHCYFGSPSVMSQLQGQAPTRDQIVDECSPEIRSFGTPEFLISTLRNWASVDAIWSIALDPTGNPIQTPNHCGGCRGAVSIDQTTGAVKFLPEYYQLGQVSAFVQPGATRIDSSTFVTYGTDSSNIETISSGLDDVAFLDPDGSKVLVAYNNSSASIAFAVESRGAYFSYTIPAQAMTTFVWH